MKKWGKLLVAVILMSQTAWASDERGLKAGEEAINKYRQTPVGVVNSSCKKNSNKYMKINYTSLSSGDINKLEVRLDQNLVGDVGVKTTFKTISGVCQDGYISCTGGTWDNCKYKKWTKASGGTIKTATVGYGGLKGCECWNEYCDKDTDGADEVINMLANGIYTYSILEENEDVVISENLRGENRIEYAGYDLSTCDQDVMKTGSRAEVLHDKKEIQTFYDEEKIVEKGKKGYKKEEKREGSMLSSVIKAGENKDEQKRDEYTRFDSVAAQVDKETGQTDADYEQSDKRKTNKVKASINDGGGSGKKIGVVYHTRSGGRKKVELCRVKKTKHGEAINEEGGAKFFLHDPYHQRTQTRECVNGECPVKAGEEKVQECMTERRMDEEIEALHTTKIRQGRTICFDENVL